MEKKPPKTQKPNSRIPGRNITAKDELEAGYSCVFVCETEKVEGKNTEEKRGKVAVVLFS